MKNTPNWFKTSAVYQINPRTFCEEGTIQAITAELPALAELGFGIMYLCPIFEEDASEDRAFWSVRQKRSETNNPKNPYRINDYFKIDEEYGTMEDLKAFIAEAHKLGMKVLLDLVYLHIGPNAPILKEHPEYVQLDEKGEILLGPWNFPLFNYENEETREYLWSNMLFYVKDLDVDGFRCDVGDKVPLDFWEEGARRIKAVKSDAVLINEGRKPEYLTVFDANYGMFWHKLLYFLLHREISASAFTSLQREFQYDGLILRDMDNHDTVTNWPYRIEEHFGHDCMELILAINYMVDGVPMVYCGNELADTTRHSMFANRFHRGVYEVADRKATGDHVERRKAVIKVLNRLKKDLAILKNGEIQWIQTGLPMVLSFRRVDAVERLTFIGNFSEEPVKVPAEAGELLLSNGATVKDGTVTLSAYGYIIIKNKKE